MKYIYIRLIRFYEKELAERDPELYGIAFLSMMMSFYVYALANIIYALIWSSEEIPSFETMIVVFVAVIIFNFFYFLRKKEWRILVTKKMEAESPMNYRVKGYLVTLFLFGGILLWVLSMYITRDIV